MINKITYLLKKNFVVTNYGAQLKGVNIRKLVNGINPLNTNELDITKVILVSLKF